MLKVRQDLLVLKVLLVLLVEQDQLVLKVTVVEQDLLVLKVLVDLLYTQFQVVELSYGLVQKMRYLQDGIYVMDQIAHLI